MGTVARGTASVGQTSVLTKTQLENSNILFLSSNWIFTVDNILDKGSLLDQGLTLRHISELFILLP